MYTPHIGRWLSKDPAGLADNPNAYVYAGGNPAKLIDPTGLYCKPPDPCSTGGCIVGKDAAFKQIKIDKIEVLKGSDKSCNLLTKDQVKKKLEEFAKTGNQKKGKVWTYNFCADDCKCEDYELPDKPKDIELKDQIIDFTDDAGLLGKVHCIIKVSGVIKMSGGAFLLLKCVSKSDIHKP
jgi:uncharacterized protein RhaS with RHS repeats